MAINEINLRDYFVHIEEGKDLSTNDFTDAYQSKLDSIESQANKYTHPTNTSYVSGLYKVTVDSLGHVVSAVAVTQSDITSLDIPSNDDIEALNPSDIGADVTVEKQQTAETGYIATYVIKQGNSQVGTKINIPKDFLVKSATSETCTVADTPLNGLSVGDHYLDFVINTKDNSGTDEHVYVNVADLYNEYDGDGSTIVLNNGVFSIKSGVIPEGSSTATDIKINGTQSAGSSNKFAKADHVHPVDTSRASSDHIHGNITNDGKVGSVANKPLITTTDGAVTTGDFESTATNIKMNGTQSVGSLDTFARGDHVHPTDTSRAAAVHTHNQYLEAEDLDDHIELTYDDTTGILKLNFK